MDILEKTYFKELTKDRSDSADMLEKPSMRGIKTSVVDKYSDQAHFIYELIQNADDAKASSARFILEHDRLLFIHDGTRRFSVSNPKTEEVDSKSGRLGDVNAITSIANSSKSDSATIGKFGVGFKAVFQYTSTPHIYDDNFKFKIERFIVPILLNDDSSARKHGETLFVFPFDHNEITAKDAYTDISEKLQSLVYPLLFMSSLKRIEYSTCNEIGFYSKKIEKTLNFDSASAQLIVLNQCIGNKSIEKKMWLFSKKSSSGYSVSVGYFLDEEGHLKPEYLPAFCYFPTKENTSLNFVVHAPFLLTDSREGIRAGINHNSQMVEMLADLSADSLLCLKQIGLDSSIKLIDDNILKIIPIDESRFSKLDDKSRISFLPVFNRIKYYFSFFELIPSTEGYVSRLNAYWGDSVALPRLFSNKQLADIVKNTNAKWAFASIARANIASSDSVLVNYIDSIVHTNLNDNAVISGRTKPQYFNRFVHKRLSIEPVHGIDLEFIEKQSIDWLHSFYKWISETKNRIELIKKKSIFLDVEGHAVPAYDENDQLVLFLPIKNNSGYTVINSQLLENEETKAFVESIGVKEPSLKDQIYNQIIPSFKRDNKVGYMDSFGILLAYYQECSNSDWNKLIVYLSDLSFILYYDANGDKKYGKPDELYFPSEELKTYFNDSTEFHLVEVTEYVRELNLNDLGVLKNFFVSVGVKKELSVRRNEISISDLVSRGVKPPYSTRQIQCYEYVIDGCSSFLKTIENEKTASKSVLLWNLLINLIDRECSKEKLSDILSGAVEYFFRSKQKTRFVSSDELLLKKSNWLIDRNGVFVAPVKISLNELADFYDVSSNAALKLIKFLGVRDDDAIEASLPDSIKEKIAFAERIQELGFSNSNLEDFVEYMKNKELQNASTTFEVNKGKRNITEVFEEESDDSMPGFEKHRDRRELVIRAEKKSVPSRDVDEDEFTHASIDYSKKIERAKAKSAEELDRIEYFEHLQNAALASKRYSFSWFKYLLEMECENSVDYNRDSKEVSIGFAKVEREPNTKRTLVLKHPSRYIPQFVEELSDIPLVLHFENLTKTLVIEVANINSYTLRVKVKDSNELAEIDFEKIVEARLEAKSPAFLLEELKNKFSLLDFDDEFDMQNNLCSNIDFVFGPPGTGKTTHLARKIITPLMKNLQNCKVLVLTPTNKSADVLVRKIMDYPLASDYENWLVRFGVTGDEVIENSTVFKEKTFDIRELNSCVTVTTISRFPYDYFMPNGFRLYLEAMKWDYIIIDEASMIPLVNIIYPLYHKTPTKFVIAGDPFQIEPITSVSLWKNENIYTMVHLDEFDSNPKTVPHRYQVELLTTQYRSIPSVGEVFSKFAYDGVLKHYREESSKKNIDFGEDFMIESLNIIKFPISKYESIYRCKRLQYSSAYQIYSALFIFEYVSRLAKNIACKNSLDLFRIGIIAPYKAQADMIDKLFLSESCPNNIDIQVGTIHGFQGDECDMIFAVFNPPPTISSSSEMFLNKMNIINVAISRARDYLFIVMPDDDTENIGNLTLINRVEKIMNDSKECGHLFTKDAEELLFEDRNYLENNTFSTSHQNVNVYGLPEKIYEIRTEESAVDIQIHRDALVKDSNDNSGSNINFDFVDIRLRSEVYRARIIGESKDYFIVPYSGRLLDYVDVKPASMFAYVIVDGIDKYISVSIDDMNNVIYIARDSFEKYRKDLLLDRGFELKTSMSGKIQLRKKK